MLESIIGFGMELAIVEAENGYIMLSLEFEEFQEIYNTVCMISTPDNWKEKLREVYPSYIQQLKIDSDA